MSVRDKNDDQVISESELEPLNIRQREVYADKLARFSEYLQTVGKDPTKEIGYQKVTERISRFHRMMKWIWRNQGLTTEFTVEHGDTVNNALATDSFRRLDGERYSEGSKRKFNDVLRNWFEFKHTDWEPEATFTDERATNNADPFRKEELQALWQASLDYKTIPSYNNLSPEERDRWKAHLAQELGKPKDEVRPDDWERINNCWKIPSLIRTTREAGWRPDLVGRLKTEWYDSNAQKIHIPEGKAPKNDSSWTQELSDEATFALDKWLKQRANQECYDGRPEVWLTRKGNSYTSGTLNELLRRLMTEAGIDQQGRNLVWYSFRHSIGTYVYNEYQDLRIVAEKLRQNSTASADRYVHPLPELKREAAKLM
jgi:integrase